MKRIKIIHEEPSSNCMEVLKSSIIEDEELKEYKIDKDTLLNELPENIVNIVLDHLGDDDKHRNFMLFLIKKGALVLHCSEEN